MTSPFIKIIPPGGWSFDEPTSQLVKVASRGLRGNDLKEFVKRAGYQFADEIRRLDLKPGDVPAHDIIIGATEYYNCNRNGDGFKEATCRKYHPTFVKHARCFRDHQNKDPNRSYGYVKLSAFNEAMKRIELLSIYNGTKEAADRNGGLVADIEIEKLAGGKDLSTSMACRVPEDVCSGCSNHARNRSEYCLGVDEGGSCRDGGLMHKIATVTGNNDNPILHADNPDPDFFDKSTVARGADRIAFAMGLNKAASGRVLGGAALAEELGVTAPADLDMPENTAELYKLACRLADFEKEAQRSGRQRLAFDPSVQPTVDWTDHDGKLGEMLQALALEKIAMPVEGFLSLVGQRSLDLGKVASLVKEHLPGIYGRLVKSGEIVDLLDNNPFVPAGKLPPLAVRRWAQKLAAAYSLDARHVEDRCIRASIRSNGLLPPLRSESLVKTAGACNPAVEEVAKRFALYKLAALHSMTGGADVARLAVWQHYS